MRGISKSLQYYYTKFIFETQNFFRKSFSTFSRCDKLTILLFNNIEQKNVPNFPKKLRIYYIYLSYYFLLFFGKFTYMFLEFK